MDPSCHNSNTTKTWTRAQDAWFFGDERLAMHANIHLQMKITANG